MKLRIITILMLCILLNGCAANQQPVETIPVETEAAAAVIQPLADTTMEALEDSIVHISFSQDDVYQDESGTILLRMQIYTYDKFDMMDISGLKTGDTILLSDGALLVNSVERNDHGTVLINGGLEEGGLDLATDDSGTYFAQGYSDMKSWYLVGEAECSVSEDFIFTDSADLEQGAVTYKAADLLDSIPASAYGYQPQNTTVRMENGQVVEMNRIYTP